MGVSDEPHRTYRLHRGMHEALDGCPPVHASVNTRVERVGERTLVDGGVEQDSRDLVHVEGDEVVASGGPEARARGLDYETSVRQSLGGIPFGEDGEFSLGLAEGVGQAE